LGGEVDPSKKKEEMNCRVSVRMHKRKGRGCIWKVRLVAYQSLVKGGQELSNRRGQAGVTPNEQKGEGGGKRPLINTVTVSKTERKGLGRTIGATIKKEGKKGTMTTNRTFQ